MQRDVEGTIRDPLHLVPGRPDAEVAQALRLKMMEAAKHVTEVMNEARLSGFFTNLQFKLNQVGEWSLDFVQFQKHF